MGKLLFYKGQNFSLICYTYIWKFSASITRKMVPEQLSVAYIVTVSELKARLSIIWSVPVYGNQQTLNNKWDVLLIYECIVWIANELSTELGCNGLHFLKMMLNMLYLCICMLYYNYLGGLEDILACLLFWMCVYMMYRIYPRVFLLQPLLSIIQYFGTPVFHIFSLNCTASSPNEY